MQLPFERSFTQKLLQLGSLQPCTHVHTYTHTHTQVRVHTHTHNTHCRAHTHTLTFACFIHASCATPVLHSLFSTRLYPPRTQRPSPPLLALRLHKNATPPPSPPRVLCLPPNSLPLTPYIKDPRNQPRAPASVSCKSACVKARAVFKFL